MGSAKAQSSSASAANAGLKFQSPALVAALRGIDAASKLLKWPSQVLWQSIADHLNQLGLEIATVNEEQGLWLQPAAQADGIDERVLQAAQAARRQAHSQHRSTAKLRLPPTGVSRRRRKKQAADSESSDEEAGPKAGVAAKDVKWYLFLFLHYYW